MSDVGDVRAEQQAGSWILAGPDTADLKLVNDYLGYLTDRHYSPHTVRAYAHDLLHLTRWLLTQRLGLAEVTTEVLLRYLAACRTTTQPGRPGRRGDNVFVLRSEEHTSELQSPTNLVCRLLLE